MIGAGVFTTSGFSFDDLGNRHDVLLAWALGGLIAICGAISYGQLAQRITESGGEYLFLSRLLHPAIGFIAGWVSLLAGFTGAIAFAATAFESYAIPHAIRPDWYCSGLAGVLSIVVFGLLHSIFLRPGLVTQNLVVTLKLILLVAFIFYAFAVFPDRWEGLKIETSSTDFSIYAIASTLVWISLSFSGFNAAVYVTGEVVEPKKNVPRALLTGTLLVTAFYLALNTIFLFGPDPELIRGQQAIAGIAAQAVGGNTLATLVRVIVSIALLSSVSSMVVAGPRVYAKMASDGVFPNFFNSSKREEMEIPVTAIWLQVLFASIVVSVSSLRALLDYLGFTLSVSAAATVACIFWTRREKESSLRRLAYSTIALIYVSMTLALAMLSAFSRPQQLVGFVATLTTGMLMYFVFQKIRSDK